MLTDRVTGGFFILLGVVLYLWVIPWQVETADYGWLKPRTLPLALAVVLGLCGVALMVKPVGDARPSTFNWLRAALFAGVLALGLWLMGVVGFVYAASPLAFAVMWLAYERRWLWLGLGSVVMPAVIWFVITIVLERTLP
ncbi:MAG: putative tricarboxylic transport membrane protein [Rhodobacteraceae bacterium HLUCCO07]|nr:MAG: putative tricarboxylic transport membrane protein [Rhodobacteraceae bacterium HLUCCO07]